MASRWLRLAQSPSFHRNRPRTNGLRRLITSFDSETAFNIFQLFGAYIFLTHPWVVGGSECEKERTGCGAEEGGEEIEVCRGAL